METKLTYKRQTLPVLLIALALIALFAGGLWVYVRQAGAEAGVTETAAAELPKESAVAITWEKYDNYPSNVSEEDLETWYQGYGLTKEEKGRLVKLQADYAAGTRPAGKAPSMPAETGFAILPLNPDDYAGMTEYYFLPNQKLTDEQLLQLIAYGEEKGEPFIADTLSVKNSMRGGAMETNRFRSAGESARRDILYRRIVEEGLRPKAQSTGEITLPLSGVADIPMNEELNYGLDAFHFNPIREMPDEEIITELLLGTDPDHYLNPAADAGLNPVSDVARARAILEDIFGMPLCAQKDLFTYTREAGTGTKLLNVTFNTPKINGRVGMYTIQVVLESWQCISLSSNVMDDSLYAYDADGTLIYGRDGTPTDTPVDIHNERCLQSARAAMEKLTGLKTVQVEPMMEVSIGNTHGKGVYIAVQMEDGKFYQLAVRFEDATVAGIDYRPEWTSMEDWRKTMGW